MKSVPEGSSVEWELLSPGAAVRFSDEAIGQLSSQRREFGLLSGRVETVSPFRVVVETTFASSRLNSEHPPLVGCYRRRLEGLPGLMPIDHEFVAHCLPSGEGIYLVLFPLGGRSVPAEFYIVKDGVIDPVLQRGVASFVRDDAPTVKATAPASRQKARFRVSPWVALSAGLAVLVVLGLADRSRSDESPGLDGGEPTAMSAIAPLQLRIIPVDSLVQLRWSLDGESRTVFTRGVLSIQDGDAQRRIALDSDQLKNSSFTYLPANRKVQFQLELTRPDLTTQVASAGYESSAPVLPPPAVVAAAPRIRPVEAPTPPRPIRTPKVVTQAQVPVHREPPPSPPPQVERSARAIEPEEKVERPVARALPPVRSEQHNAEPPRVRYERNVDEREPAVEPPPRKGIRAKLSRMWPFRRKDSGKEEQ
jgi:hypothetical protein